MLEIVESHVWEKNTLSLGNPLCHKDEGLFDMVDFPDNKFSIVSLYKHIEKHFMPPPELGIEVGRFFRRAASRKQMKVCGVLLYI